MLNGEMESSFGAAICDAVQGIVILLDSQGRILRWNSYCERLTGYNGDEIRNKPFWDALIPPGERDSVRVRIEGLGPASQPSAWESAMLSGDGSRLPVRWSAASLAVDSAAGAGFVITGVPVGDPESHDRYGAMFEGNPYPMWIVDLDTRGFLEVNDAASAQYGFSREEFASMSVHALHPPEEMCSLEAARALVLEGRTSRRETRHRTKTGKMLPVECTCQPFRYAGRRAALTIVRDITALRRAEETERRYRDLVDGFTVGVYRTTPEGRVLMANPALLRMMGYRSLDQLAARNLEENGFEADVPRSRFREAVETGGSILRDACWRRLDGSLVFVREHARAVRADDGRVLYYEGVVEDITERKRAKERLRESEERFRQLFENAPIAYHEIDRQGIVRNVNAAECTLLGLPKDQILNRPVWELLSPADREKAKQAVERKFLGQQALTPLYREYLHAGGASRFVEIHETFVYGADGQVKGIRSAMVDITARKRVEEALRWSEARFRAVFEGAAIGIITADTQGRITAINPSLERMLGYSAAELRGRHFGVLAVTEDRDRDADLNAELLSGKRDRLQMEKRYTRKDGTAIWVRVTPSLARDTQAEPDFVIAMVEDITERKKAEEALRRTVDDLTRTNAELEHFAYVASHDVQEPLRMVTSFMQLLSMRYKGRLDEDADEFITYAVEGATRIRLLIDDLLAYSRLEARGKPFVATETRYAAEQALANLASTVEETGADVQIGNSLPLIAADPGQLVHLFQNLIGNALKFRGSGRTEVRVSAERLECAWRFHVQDNGIGIDRRHHERIFEILGRLHTKAEYPGSGLGLAVSKKIVERHGGAIGVESEPGQGSTFWFTIPDNAVPME